MPLLALSDLSPAQTDRQTDRRRFITHDVAVALLYIVCVRGDITAEESPTFLAGGFLL